MDLIWRLLCRPLPRRARGTLKERAKVRMTCLLSSPTVIFGAGSKQTILFLDFTPNGLRHWRPRLADGAGWPGSDVLIEAQPDVPSLFQKSYCSGCRLLMCDCGAI